MTREKVTPCWVAGQILDLFHLDETEQNQRDVEKLVMMAIRQSNWRDERKTLKEEFKAIKVELNEIKLKILKLEKEI